MALSGEIALEQFMDLPWDILRHHDDVPSDAV